jgi:DNA-binding Lrp family transcriptional regulator
VDDHVAQRVALRRATEAPFLPLAGPCPRDQGSPRTPARLDLRFQALLWLSVAPAHLHEVGEEFATHPEAAYVAATTGSTNLVTSVVCSRVPDLYRYITERVSVVPAVNVLETAPVMRTIKSATRGVRVGGTAL